MIQEIITLIIVFGAVLYTLYNIYLIFYPKKNSNICSGACNSCSFKASSIDVVKMSL